MTYKEYVMKKFGVDEDTLISRKCPGDYINLGEDKHPCPEDCEECWNTKYQDPLIIDNFNKVLEELLKLSDDEINEIFGVSGIDVVLKYYTIPQIIEKYNVFSDNLQCGDFVKFSYFIERQGYIINIDDDHYDIIDTNGYYCRGIPKVCILEKTGKYSEYFATLHDEIIKHLKEENV